MKAEMLKRLVRAIAVQSQDDLDRLAETIINAEREGGHSRLAGELEAILEEKPKRGRTKRSEIRPERTIRELPISRRHHEMLVSFIPHDLLEHHIVLAPEIEDRFGHIEKEYAARERLSAYGLHPRKKVLLYGPPGCGKTLGAKRIAWNTGLSLMKVRFDALVSSYFGESASNLRTVFDAAREQPCVLLLDECDFIARSRGCLERYRRSGSNRQYFASTYGRIRGTRVIGRDGRTSNHRLTRPSSAGLTMCSKFPYPAKRRFTSCSS